MKDPDIEPGDSTSGTQGRRRRAKRLRNPVAARWKTMTPEQRRAAVVQAVLKVISKHGVHGTTTARIAAALGLSEPTMYRVFPSRRAMLLATAQSLWTQRRRELESFVPADSMDYLRKLSEYHTTGIQRTMVSRFLHELAVAKPSDGLRDYLRGEMVAEAERLAQIVEEGKEEGCIKLDVDAMDVAWRIMGVYWLEAMARLYGLEDVLLTGFSNRMFASILDDIAADVDVGGFEKLADAEKPAEQDHTARVDREGQGS